MKEESKEFMEASMDEQWVEKIRNAENLQVLEALFAEKGIEVPEELKKAYITGTKDKMGELNDEDLEKVSGGWFNLLNCPKTGYLFVTCSLCPHLRREILKNSEDSEHLYKVYCEYYSWSRHVVRI